MGVGTGAHFILWIPFFFFGCSVVLRSESFSVGLCCRYFVYCFSWSSGLSCSSWCVGVASSLLCFLPAMIAATL